MATPSDATRPPLPPFTRETAQLKVKSAQDVWNTRYFPPPPFPSSPPITPLPYHKTDSKVATPK